VLALHAAHSEAKGIYILNSQTESAAEKETEMKKIIIIMAACSVLHAQTGQQRTEVFFEKARPKTVPGFVKPLEEPKRNPKLLPSELHWVDDAASCYYESDNSVSHFYYYYTFHGFTLTTAFRT